MQLDHYPKMHLPGEEWGQIAAASMPEKWYKVGASVLLPINKEPLWQTHNIFFG